MCTPSKAVKPPPSTPSQVQQHVIVAKTLGTFLSREKTGTLLKGTRSEHKTKNNNTQEQARKSSIMHQQSVRLDHSIHNKRKTHTSHHHSVLPSTTPFNDCHMPNVKCHLLNGVEYTISDYSVIRLVFVPPMRPPVRLLPGRGGRWSGSPPAKRLYCS